MRYLAIVAMLLFSSPTLAQTFDTPAVFLGKPADHSEFMEASPKYAGNPFLLMVEIRLYKIYNNPTTNKASGPFSLVTEIYLVDCNKEKIAAAHKEGKGLYSKTPDVKINISNMPNFTIGRLVNQACHSTRKTSPVFTDAGQAGRYAASQPFDMVDVKFTADEPPAIAAHPRAAPDPAPNDLLSIARKCVLISVSTAASSTFYNSDGTRDNYGGGGYTDLGISPSCGGRFKVSLQLGRVKDGVCAMPDGYGGVVIGTLGDSFGTNSIEGSTKGWYYCIYSVEKFERVQ